MSKTMWELISEMSKWLTSKVLSRGLSHLFQATLPWRMMRLLMARFRRDLWVVSFEASESTTNWKLGFAAAFSLYKLSFGVNTCAEVMVILPLAKSV